MSLLTLLRITKHYPKRIGLYRCQCGKEKEIRMWEVEKEVIKSCGCYNRQASAERSRTHGLHGMNEYWVWAAIKQRCYNQKNVQYKDYGGRGLTVCDEWKDDFRRFIGDMKRCPEGLSLERLDNNKGYSPDNCVWGDKQQQALNRRKRGY